MPDTPVAARNPMPVSTFRCTAPLRAAVDARAAAEGIATSDLIRRALTAYLEREAAPTAA